MLNLKFLLNNLDIFINKVKVRSKDFDVDKLLVLYNLYKKMNYELEFLQCKRNFWSKKIFFYKKKKINIDFLFYIVKLIKFSIVFYKKKISIVFGYLNDLVLYMPNLASDDVPVGLDDKDNKVILKWGNINKYNFEVLDHIKCGYNTGEINFEDAALLSGSSYVVMKKNISLLYRSISQFMLNYNIIFGKYLEVYTPYIVKKECLFGTGQLPKFSKDLFYVNKYNDIKNNMVLIPTAEVSLVNLFKNKLINIKKLPIKLVSCTPCFRSEKLSYGKNNRGILRLHQFDKVELVQVTHPDKSFMVLEELTNDAENILKLLNLPYRKVLLCTNSMSFSSCKTYDLEVWSPIENNYIEVSSCSNTSDFQSRRINAKYIDKNKKKGFLHIINGSALAVGRTLISILENHQISTGIVKLPKVLVGYTNGIKYMNFNKVL